MKHLLLLTSLILIGLRVTAQHALITEHSFAPELEVPEKVLAMKEPTVVLNRTVIVDIEEVDGDAVEYYLGHFTIFLRDVASIEAENKVYINLNRVIEVSTIKARSITPDGTIKELGAGAFNRATDDEERGNQIYFAFEGLTPGSVIDYFYVFKKQAKLRGDHESLQVGVPILSQDLHLIHPEPWIFRTKSYMGAPEATMDTSLAGVTHHRYVMENVPALEREESANMGAAQMRVVYFLDRVPERNITDFSGFVGATQLYHNALSAPVDARTGKELHALVKKMKLSFTRDEEDKVRTMEDHLKSSFAIIDASTDELDDIGAILKNKACSKLGMIKLTCALLQQVHIDYQIVITTDRTRMPFDPDLECYLFLQDIILYLPSLNKYMAPSEVGLRLGYAMSENMGNPGLFIRRFDLGGTFAGVGSVKYIEALPDEATIHDHVITADLSKDPSTCELKFTNLISGYYAPLQCFYSYLDDDKKKEYTEGMVSYLLENSTVEELKVKNGESKLFGVEPFIIEGRVNTRKFNGTAGDKVVFKVGELIGRQVEMYAEKSRTLPVEEDYNRRFNRSIDIILPAGWSVQNLKDLELEKHVDLDGERKLAFKSSYVQEGQVIKVRIEEYYRSIRVPLEQFEEYRSVINAAADFSKVALLLAQD